VKTKPVSVRSNLRPYRD